MEEAPVKSASLFCRNLTGQLGGREAREDGGDYSGSKF